MRYLRILILLVLFTTPLSAQIEVLPKEYVDSIVKLARADTLSFYARARYAEKATTVAAAINYEEGKFQSRMAEGIAYLNVSQFDKALNSFQQAYQIGRALENQRFKAYSAYYLGNLKAKIQLLDESMISFEESLNLYTQLKDTVWMGNVMNGMGILYAEQNNTGKALETLETALSLYKQQGLEEYTAFPLSNIGNYYLEYLDQPELALNYFQQTLKLDQKYKSAKGEAISLENLGLAYHRLGQYNAAVDHYMQSLEIAQKQHFNELISKNYKNLCKSYEAKGDLKNALQYLGKHQVLQDSILNVSKNAQIADLLAFFDSEQKEQDLLESRETIAQLEQEKKISNLWTAILAGSVLALVIIFYLLFKQLRTRRKLVEIDLKNNQLEREKLSRELEFKNKDLTNFALDIARKNEFSNMVHESLKEIVNSPPNESRTKARELLMSTSNHLQINDDIKEFQMNVETVNQDFFNRLTDQFPDLTPNERHLCGLIRLNLSTKEIAVIRNISPKSVEMGRYRLRKKLNLGPKEEITNFLQDF